MTKKASLGSARHFILREGRLLERRAAAAFFGEEDAGGALEALAGYRNDDGGFGQSLEPDKRVPASQPLDVEVAFGLMDFLGRVDEELVKGACDFLETLGPGVGCLLAGALDYPHAAHWGEWGTQPSLNPTAGLVARLWKWGIDHPWREQATRFCWTELESGLPGEAHTFSEVLLFLDEVPADSRREAVEGELASSLSSLELFHLDPSEEGYGLTPLHLAPSPTSHWIRLFADDVIERNLDALEAAQADDGGWQINWETVGPAAVQEWRGIETLRAIRTLRAFGRLDSPSSR